MFISNASLHLAQINAENTRKQGTTYRVSLKLDFQLRSILEHPLHNIGIWRSSLDRHAALEGAPEVAEALELDQVPDGAEGGGDNG